MFYPDSYIPELLDLRSHMRFWNSLITHEYNNSHLATWSIQSMKKNMAITF